MILAGHDIKDRDLIWGVMHNLKGPSKYRHRGKERWVIVMEVFAVGSTVAHALCREFDLDPDEVLKK